MGGGGATQITGTYEVVLVEEMYEPGANLYGIKLNGIDDPNRALIVMLNSQVKEYDAIINTYDGYMTTYKEDLSDTLLSGKIVDAMPDVIYNGFFSINQDNNSDYAIMFIGVYTKKTSSSGTIKEETERTFKAIIV